MRKKIFRRALSVLLAAVMLFGCVSAAAAADRPNYVVLGDSIAYGAGLTNPKQAVYGKIVADTDGFDYRNFAIPGHTTNDLLNMMKTKRVRTALRSADIVSVSIGGNNFLLGNLMMILYDGIVKNDYSRVKKILDGFVVDLNEIATRIHALNPNAVILLQTIYNPQTGYAGEVYGHGAAMLNNAIKAYAQNTAGVLLVDVAARLTDSEKDFARDRIHPSAAGNEKIARAVLETLYANGLGSKKEPVVAVKGRDAFGTEFLAFSVSVYCTALHDLSPILSALPL